MNASAIPVYDENSKFQLLQAPVVNYTINVYIHSMKTSDLIAHIYSQIQELSATGVRFVGICESGGPAEYGPVFLFTKAVLAREAI